MSSTPSKYVGLPCAGSVVKERIEQEQTLLFTLNTILAAKSSFFSVKVAYFGVCLVSRFGGIAALLIWPFLSHPYVTCITAIAAKEKVVIIRLI